MTTSTKTYQLLLRFYKGLPLIILCMVAGMLLAKRYLAYTVPLYESTAKVKLADKHNGVANSNLYKDFDLFTNTNEISAEVELLKSKVLIRKAVGNLGLETRISRLGTFQKKELYRESPVLVHAMLNEAWMNKPFKLIVNRDSLVKIILPGGQTVQGSINQPIATVAGNITVTKNEAAYQRKPYLLLNDSYEFVVLTDEQLVNDVISNLDVMSVDKNVPVLRVSYKSSDPQKAADITNAIVAAYITDYIDEKIRSADTTSDFVNRELKNYSNKLTASENAIENFRDGNNIINIRQQTETDLRKIADLKKQKAALQMNLRAVDSLDRYINNGQLDFDALAPNYEAFTDLLSTELLKKAKELQREKRTLLARYTPQHETIKAIDADIADINRYIIEGIHNTRNHLQIQYNDLSNTIDESERAFNGLPTKEKKYTILERQFDLNEQIYRFLAEKRTESEIAKAARISFHRIISEAAVPVKPVSPNATLIKALAGLLGFLSGLAMIYLFHLIKAGVGNEETIYKTSVTPLAAIVPFVSKTKSLLVFKKWVTTMQLKGYLNNGSIVVVSSFKSGEGKTFISKQLIKAITQTGKKLLIVNAEGNLSSTTSADHVSLTSLPGWQQPAILQASIQQWQQVYDVILICNMPIHKEPDALLLMAPATVNYWVLDSRRSKSKYITEADLLQQDLCLPNIQFVLNRAGFTPGLWHYTKSLFNKIFKKTRA